MSRVTIYEQANEEYKNALSKKMTTKDLDNFLLEEMKKLLNIDEVRDYVIQRASKLKKTASFRLEADDLEGIVQQIPYHLHEKFQSCSSTAEKMMNLWLEHYVDTVGEMTCKISSQGFSNTVIIEFSF